MPGVGYLHTLLTTKNKCKFTGPNPEVLNQKCWDSFHSFASTMGLDSGGKVKDPAVDMQIHHWPMRARMVSKVG